MKKLNTVAMLFAVAALGGCATSGTGTPAPGTVDNWKNVDGNVWKNGTNELCWRNNTWTPATADSRCDGYPPPPPPPPPAPVTPPPPPPPPPPVAPPAPTSEKVTFAADAFFDFDKAVLKPEGKAKLDDIVSKMSGLNLEVVIAVGHTDSIGSDAYNQKLSVRRAEAVKAYLVKNFAIPEARFVTVGNGSAKPMASNSTEDGRALNRRTDIKVVLNAQ
jgi:OOP family OmpA-OmpF porin